MRRSLVLVLLCLAVGCAGPNRVSRSLDLRVNQLYVDNPTLATVLNPLCWLGMNGAWVVDSFFVNPWYFWNDVQVGRGTAYFYTDPVTPENPEPAALARAGSVATHSAYSSSNSHSQDLAAQGAAGSGPIPYTVQEGDTLASIARRYYGEAGKWKRIYMANQNVLTSPDRLRPGLVLVIPQR